MSLTKYRAVPPAFLPFSSPKSSSAAAAALDDLGLLNGKKAGGTARYFVSDTPDNFDELAHTFLGEYAGGTVERIAIETY